MLLWERVCYCRREKRKGGCLKTTVEERDEILDYLHTNDLLSNVTTKSGRAWFDIETIHRLVTDKGIDVQVYASQKRTKRDSKTVWVSTYEVAFFKGGVEQLAFQESDSLIEAWVLALAEVFDILPKRLKPKKREKALSSVDSELGLVEPERVYTVGENYEDAT